MVAGIFAIVIGSVVLAIAGRWADNMAKNVRKAGSEVDPAVFKIAMGIVGLAGIIYGIVLMTRSLR